MASKHNTRSSKPPPRQGDKSPVTPTSDIGRAAAFSGGRNAGSRSTPSSPTSTRAGFRLPFSDLGEGGFPATEVIRYLLKTVDRDVVTFRRNTQVPYMILDRVRELVNGIDGLIKKVEEGTGDWNSFDAYSRAIAPLEDLLLQLLAFTEVEKTQHLADPGSVDNAIVSSEKWEAHRGVFMRYLGELHTRPELAGIVVSKDTSTAHQESLEAQAGDDRALFEDVLSAAKGRFSDVVPTHASNIETSLGALRKRFAALSSETHWHTAGFSIIAVKASLLVEGVLQVLEAATLGGSVLRHLRSATVWDSFLELFRSLSTVTISEDGIAQVTDKYDSLLRIIKTLPGHELPASYVDIIKRAAYVRPPFREQAFALVTLCHDLATQFNNAADSTDDNVRTLNEAFSVTLRSLEAASRAVSQLTIFDLTRFEDNGIVESFEQAKTSIRDGFISYGLDKTWEDKESALTSARQRDKELTEKLNSLLRKASSSSSNSGGAHGVVTVDITSYHQRLDGTRLGSTQVKLESSALLRTVRWKASATLGPDRSKSARSGGALYLASDLSKALSLGLRLSDLTADEDEDEEDDAKEDDERSVSLSMVVP